MLYFILFFYLFNHFFFIYFSNYPTSLLTLSEVFLLSLHHWIDKALYYIDKLHYLSYQHYYFSYFNWMLLKFLIHSFHLFSNNCLLLLIRLFLKEKNYWDLYAILSLHAHKEDLTLFQSHIHNTIYYFEYNFLLLL